MYFERESTQMLSFIGLQLHPCDDDLPGSRLTLRSYSQSINNSYARSMETLQLKVSKRCRTLLLGVKCGIKTNFVSQEWPKS